MKASELINTNILPLRKSDKAGTALHWMNEYKLNYLPVVEHQKYLGLVSFRNYPPRMMLTKMLGNSQKTLSDLIF
jgi:predicted transcriptional regulator